MGKATTTSERNLEKYFKQRGLVFKREPFGDRSRKPDYLFVRDRKRILVEVKELEHTPLSRELDYRHSAGVTGTFSFDAYQVLDLMRDHIKKACRQLKPYHDRVDYTLVLLALKSPYDTLANRDVLYAMYGDPVLTFQISKRTGAAVGPMRQVMRVNGALRKNDKTRGEMYSPHGAYLSGVGVIERFHAASYYQRRYLGRFKRRSRDLREMLLESRWRWERHRPHVPRIYRSANRYLYRMRLVSNVLGERPLPAGIINGRWDEFIKPVVNHE